jgi:hypothetical protein
MKDLFNYLKDSDELTLIKKVVFFIMKWNSFILLDGNGRMGKAKH